ncbi:hypothetical protein Adu01nite_00790 [Paractinoplanes durhamensis]|uniref:Uncharacterized protein n=1 Tax=Paractinoplanes durhamensis TaxID=113563 RepID=A0ABQ3YMC3_9ACTN|nr:hypothetical protein Adu01nite_00790 [Actinoplanes durhamensis]
MASARIRRAVSAAALAIGNAIASNASGVDIALVSLTSLPFPPIPVRVARTAVTNTDNLRISAT